MNCGDREERLALYISGDLSRQDAEEAERHLAECLGCQVFASGLRESLELLRQEHREPPAPAHFAAVRARVLAEIARERRPLWRRGWILAMTAAAAAVLAVLAIRVRFLTVAVQCWGLLDPVAPPPMVTLAHPPAPPLVAPAPVSKTQTQRRIAAKAARPGEPVLIRVVSDNPDVVIYWITETKGE